MIFQFLKVMSYLVIESPIVKIQPYDLVTIRPDPLFRTQKKITIQGFVYYPGDYVIESPKKK